MLKSTSPMTQPMEDLIQETLAEILKNMGVEFRKFKVSIDDAPRQGGSERTTKLYRIDIDTDESATLIGHHGENVYALQHVLKTVVWKKTGENIFIILDIDGYRKRQETSVLNLAKRKVEVARKTGEMQTLPPMSPYFRRTVHLALAIPEYSDIVTESTGDGDERAVTIRVK